MRSSYVTAICAAVTYASVLSIARAESCTPLADKYFGTLSPDGVCYPLDKKVAKFFDRNNDCMPNLEGRGMLVVDMATSAARFAARRNAASPPKYKCELFPPPIVSGCTPPAEEYGGMWGADGKCHPIRKSRLIDVNDCTPDLKGRGTLTYSLLYTDIESAGCVIPVKPLPRSSPPDDLQQQLNDLRDEVERLKSERQ